MAAATIVLGVASLATSVWGSISGAKERRKQEKAAQRALMEQRFAAGLAIEDLEGQRGLIETAYGASKAGAEASIMGSLFEALNYDKNANASLLDGIQTMKQGTAMADQVGKEARFFEGAQKVAFLKSGVDLGGSPLLVLENTRLEAAKEVESILQEAQYRADTAKSNAEFLETSADMVGYMGKVEQASNLTSVALTRAKGHQDITSAVGAIRAGGANASAAVDALKDRNDAATTSDMISLAGTTINTIDYFYNKPALPSTTPSPTGTATLDSLSSDTR